MENGRFTLIKRLIFVVSALGLCLACGSRNTNGNFSSGSTASPTPSGGGGAGGGSSTIPFEVVVNTQYEVNAAGTGPFTLELDCQIPNGSPAGTVQACNPAIPEGRLHFSQVSWTVNVGAGAAGNGCEILFFQPYWYLASTNAAFSPSWENGTAINCSTSPLPTGCFSGPASDPNVIADFPTHTALYAPISEGLTFTWTANSANNMGRASNRWAVNNLAAASRGTAHIFKGGSDSYSGTQYVDYSFVCADHWAQPVYSFTMTLTDVDINGGPNVPGNILINQYPDWDPGSWDF